MTQERLGALVGLKQGNISEFENGVIKPTLDTIGKLADALGVDAHEMFASYEKIAPAVDLLHVMAGLSDDQREAVITYAEMLKARRSA